VLLRKRGLQIILSVAVQNVILYGFARNKFKNIALDDRFVIACVYLPYPRQKLQTKTEHTAINCLSQEKYYLAFMLFNCCNNFEYFSYVRYYVSIFYIYINNYFMTSKTNKNVSK
jgi:hypothetical protein